MLFFQGPIFTTNILFFERYWTWGVFGEEKIVEAIFCIPITKVQTNADTSFHGLFMFVSLPSVRLSGSCLRHSLYYDHDRHRLRQIQRHRKGLHRHQDHVQKGQYLPSTIPSSAMITCTAKTGYQKFDTTIPRKGIALPQSQFPHSCVYERFHDRFAYSAGGKYMDRSRE